MPIVEPDRIMAQVVKITSINPIQDANVIEVASVLGWNVVVKKGDFNVGDLVIYFTLDSVLDDTKEYAKFLNNKPLKTKKIKNILSQGLLGPLDWLKYHGHSEVVQEGDDLTKFLNVKKYVDSTEGEIYNVKKNTFPEFVPKTDEHRIQGMMKKLNNLRDRNIVITKKFDGTSVTYIYSKNELENKFLVCSRNNIVDYAENSELKDRCHYYEMNAKYQIEEKMKMLNKNIAIQGEICGPKINCNRLKMTENDLYVFNIYDIDNNKYLIWDDVLKITTLFGLKTVDVLFCGKIKEEYLDLKNLILLADSQTYNNNEVCEGIVVKTDDYDERTSFKVISNNYLLKYKI